jgi:hypothetical protein
MGILLLAGATPQVSLADYAFAGQGMTNVLAGTVTNGNLFWSTVRLWQNPITGLPSTNQAAFTLPECDRIPVCRLVMTVWGGTADYSCQMTVKVNDTNLPSANPFAFGTAADASAVFDASAPCAYGSGYGVWLVTLPVPGALLHSNGASNTVEIAQTTPDSFDGRINQVTLVAVYESASLSNLFDYAIAEGSGDIYKSPTGAQVSQRTATFAGVSTNNATSATLTALYTYGDTSQNDRLYFNDAQYGSDNVAQWNAGIANYGPSLVGFDVLANLAATNSVTFSVGSEVPAPQESTLRPQLAALAVTRAREPQSAGTLALTGFDVAGAHLVWSGPMSGPFAIEACTNLASPVWKVLTNFTSAAGILGVTDADATKLPQRFYRAKTQ